MLAGTAVAQDSGGSAPDRLERTQKLGLKKGWNAVYLEVAPRDSDPAVVFGGMPVDIVATYFGSKGSAQFATDPGIDLFRNLGWAVWYAGGRQDAFLSSLAAIYGSQAYLVHAKSDFQWEVKGAPLREEMEWRVDQFNLAGFPVASPGAPSFEEFFAGSKGPRLDRIYRLVDGSWQKLASPAATPMRSGEAFWIFCDAPSTCSGPLEVETRFRRGLVLAEGGTDSLVLRNTSGDPLQITLEHLTPLAASVPLSISVKVVGGPSTLVQTGAVIKPAEGWSETFNLGAGGSLALPFQARSAEMTAPLHASLLKVTTSLGTEAWVPVYATRSDLQD